jgi:hypothetical protein
MDPELQKILDAINAYADKGKILTAIKENPALKNDLYQPAFNDGHGVAVQQHQSTKTTLENKIRTVEQERDEAKAQLEDWKKKNPDTAALHSEYGKKLQDKETELATLRGQRRSERMDAERQRIRDSVYQGLLDQKVDKDKAAAMADANASRYVVEANEKDDTISSRILQLNGSTAYAGDSTAQVTAIVADLFKTVPKKLIGTEVPGGGSAGDGQAAGDDAGGTEKTAVFDRVAKQAREVFKSPTFGQAGGDGQPLNPEQELNRRLGRRVTS